MRQVNMASMWQMPQVLMILNMFFKILVAVNILQSKDNENFPRIKQFQFVIIKAQNSGLECRFITVHLTQCSYFNSIFFAFEI